VIKDIIDGNSYPIVFIGSGISKRYLKNFPTWSSLLQEYWEQIDEPNSIFQFMRELERSEIPKEISDSEKEFLINVKTASYIQEKFDDLFYSGRISLSGLTDRDAYSKKISPFKYSIANRFVNYEIKPEMLEEIEEYKNFLSKAKVIVTTNYDTLTEKLLSDLSKKPTIYIGQKGFFDETYNWAELFKIHGDVSDPSSIVITEEDYNTYDKNSILISAKILVNLIQSPIIFLGYSLSDRNVQKLLVDFAKQLPTDDMRKNNNRITVVEYEQGNHEFNEQIVNNTDLSISHSIIKTDNFKKIYTEIAKINQGLTPYEVSRFQESVKSIVISAGKKGKLDSYLVSPQNIDSLPEDIKQRRIVVALGDKKNMFVNPSYVDYVEDYFNDGGTFLPEVALRFIANENTQARLPFVKYLKDVDYEKFEFLSKKQKEKISKRIEKMGALRDIVDTVPKNNKREYSNLNSILLLNAPKTRELELIAYNIERIPINNIIDYINKNVIPNLQENYNNNAPELSAQRRLLLAYDLIANGDIK